jgi:hypothetical protein
MVSCVISSIGLVLTPCILSRDNHALERSVMQVYMHSMTAECLVTSRFVSALRKLRLKQVKSPPFRHQQAQKKKRHVYNGAPNVARYHAAPRGSGYVQCNTIGVAGSPTNASITQYQPKDKRGAGDNAPPLCLFQFSSDLTYSFRAG